jgi:GT2 family glycosyltransferase
MRTSIIIAAHNEGEALWQTVQSCIETCAGLDYEIVIADDASVDDSVEEVQRRFPHLRVVRHDERRGAAPTKNLGAREARGDVLVFLDGHCKPEYGAITRLVQDVEETKGNAVITPAIAGLDVRRWRNSNSQVGHGYFLDLENFHCGWLPLSELRVVDTGRKRFYESPALIGCALALSRELYEELWGFDRNMRMWGVEDLDFGLKSWLMGHPILHDPEAVVGHRFRASFDNYDVPVEHTVVNQLRMARKNFTQGVWSDWVDRCRLGHLGRLPDHPEGLWARVWELFEEQRASVEQERGYLLARRQRDEFWYAERFGLTWPRLHSASFTPSASGHGAVAPAAAMALEASPSPSPPPCPIVTVEIDDPTTPGEDFRTVEYAIFRTLSPRLRITLNPPTNPQPGQFQVIVDDGEDATDEVLDISSYFSFSGGQATANLPETVPLNSLPGPNQSTFRALFTDPNTVRIMYFGENRLRFKLNGNDCFKANFLHHDAFDKTVVGINDGAEPIPGEPDNRMMTNHIILNFDPASTDAAISQFLLDQTLRPQGITRHLGVVQVRDAGSLSGTALLARIADLGSALGNSDAAHIDRTVTDSTMSGDRYTAAFTTDFAAAGSWSAAGRNNHFGHWVMQTFTAHRLIDLARDPAATIRVFQPGSGICEDSDFSGAAANDPNKYFVRGNRLFQATDIADRDMVGGKGRVAVTLPGDAGNPNIGDVSNVGDADPGHDSGVLAYMAGDGVGDQPGGVARTINQVVLGTGKDVQVRPVRFSTKSTLAYYKTLELSTADVNTRIHMIERAYTTANPAPAAVATNLDRLYAAIANAGKLIVGVAGNYNANLTAGDAGRIGPARATSRKDLAGADAFKKNVVTVGYTLKGLMPNVEESREAIDPKNGSNFGPTLTLVAPNDMLTVTRTGALSIQGGSSFSTPLVAGIAAELMLVDPTLQQAANIAKVAEYIEATTDHVGAAANPNDDVGRGRVNFWTAALSAANGGLSTEGRAALPNGNDNFFQFLPLRDEAATTWYGFDVRTSANNLVLWYRNSLGVYSNVQDAGQNRPAITDAAADSVLTYVSTQPRRNAAGRILPLLPFSAAELTAAGVAQRFWAGFSAKRDQLADKTAILALPIGKNPNEDPETVVFELPLNDRTDLRRAQGATGANKDLIKALVKEFTDFVLYIDHAPVAQVRARLPNQAFTVGQTNNVALELKNVGASDIPVGRWIIRGQLGVLLFDDVADFGPLAAGATKVAQVRMNCVAAGTVTLHVTLLRAANSAGNPVVATPVGGGANDSQDGTMTCTNP